ncbi:MAG: 16S rRNA (uracil(1498)-N(3))-methyltransferase [Duncaniella sp.]|nr:16S rRNA (uracil(1498)-N(3))-methyltransferase [Duncaniella sp.]
MIRFYAPDIAETLTLPESDSGHAVRVLRLGAGAELEVTDGQGRIYSCRIADPHPKHARVELTGVRDCPPVWTQEIVVAVAPTKHIDRMEWLVEKLVEIGISRFIPVLTSRSERKIIKRERIEKIAVSAMKQSLKATLPVIDDMMPLAEVLTLMPDAQRYVGYCDDAVERRDFARTYTPRRDTLILIGPEGDFSPAEIERVLGAGIIPVTFGDNRLRTETAALYAASACHILDAHAR